MVEAVGDYVGGLGSRSLVARVAGVMVFMAALVCTILAAVPVPAHAAVSATISGDDQALDAAGSLTTAGILSDWDPSQGVPQDYITRGSLAILLARALDLEDAESVYFADVPDSLDCFGAVGALHEIGLVNGPTSDTFAPEETISRRWAVLWIMEALGHKVSQQAAPTATYRMSYFEPADRWLGGFRDRPMLGVECSRAAANACRLGIIDATSEGWFYPTIPLSWGDAVIMLDRAFVRPPGAREWYPETRTAVQDYPQRMFHSRGPLVCYLQHRLDELKYFVGKVDGIFGRQTRDAIVAFHKVEGMRRVGAVTDSTWARLPDAETPTPKLSDSGTRVEVDLTRQVLFMITDDQVWKIVHVSTGSGGTRTGHFQIGNKYKGHVACVTVDGVMYYPSYVVSRTAIHGYPSVPTYPASHGCVRVPMWIAEQLWYETPTGMTVDIYYDE